MRSIRVLRTLFLAFLVSLAPAASFAGVFVSITVAPPVMPIYAQPVCPTEGYLWTPGYWAYGPAGYYWVPGVWVAPPQPGLLWTPGYWGFAGGIYGWHGGYWGPRVGFYGGVNYGYGYPGVGFVGGRWAGGHFAYNTAVMHVNTTIVHNTYVDRTVIHNTVINRTSFNGPGGLQARATPGEMAAAREQHFQATSEQQNHERTASTNRANFASVNGGRPGTPAVAHTAAYNNNRPAYNNNNANRPAYNSANNANRAPAGNQAHYTEAPHNNPAGAGPHNAPAPHEGGGQPHESHPNGGEEHERR
jgi:hypothetical protein